MKRRNALALRVLLGTAVRSSELVLAKWQDVDLADGKWHIPTSKTGTAMDVPLAPIVIRWFAELKGLAEGSSFVLPAHARSRTARHGGEASLHKDTLREAIDHWLETRKPAIRRFTPHDLRSTVKSHLRALGVPRDISEMCLNHKLTGVEGIYDRHNYYEDRLAALGKWAAVLEALEPVGEETSMADAAAEREVIHT
jgi:integrase